MTLQQLLTQRSLSIGAAAKILNLSRSTVSRVASHEYPNWQSKEQELIKSLEIHGYSFEQKNTEQGMSFDAEAFVITDSVAAYNDLAQDLANPESSLSSSLGMVIGTAELGKTFTSKRFAAVNPNAVYVLYIDGSSITQVLRDMCYELSATRPYSMSKCITVLEQSCRYQRRLVIIDEADKCPIKLLETLRGINERCNLPFLFVGEEMLKAKVDQVPRLRSRIRNPIVVFKPVHEVEIATYYQMAAGVKLDVTNATLLSRRARGGFRTVANEARALINIANASGIMDITEQMIKQL